MKRRGGPPVEAMPAHLEVFDPSEWGPMTLHTAYSSWVTARERWMEEHPGSVDFLDALAEHRRVRLWVADQTRAP